MFSVTVKVKIIVLHFSCISAGILKVGRKLYKAIDVKKNVVYVFFSFVTFLNVFYAILNVFLHL